MIKEEMIKKTVLITGDVTIDHNIYQGKRDTPDSKEFQGTMVIDSPGGARLLFEMINEVSKTANKKDKEKIVEYTVQFGLDSGSFKDLPATLHSYAFWSLCPIETGYEEMVWRVVKPMGYGSKDNENHSFRPKISKEAGTESSVIVIDDGGFGFRSSTSKDAWPIAIKEENVNTLDWVALKMSSPVARGDLWRALSKNFMEKLIVVISIDDIRLEEVVVTKGLSWERSAQDLISELMFNARISDLTKCRHLIINFSSEGALWMSNNKGVCVYRLIFKPSSMESEWSERLKGKVFGNVSCLAAGIINQLVLPEDKMDIGAGIISGLSAMRALLKFGHGSTGDTKPDIPYNKLADEIVGASSGYSITEVPAPLEDITSHPAHWTILGGLHGGTDEKQRSFYGLGRRAALFGPKVLNNIPYTKFAKLFTVDRSEIESLRSIQQLIKDYDAKPRSPKPLSIAVFGPPGAGKSFGVKQIAKTVFGDNVPFLEFNLAQFSEQKELISALHQVRDRVLEGKTPFVFWDEFDSKELNWLQYLLAPMQDGKFLEGQINHPIGKSVFVFTGGTSYNMDSFANPSDEATFKRLKGPDFIGRLSGYLNVLGPNRRRKYDKESNSWVDDDNPVDICFPVRRALCLRVILGLNDDEEMDIDKGLLTAFLEIDRYKHGTRSLETIALLTKGSRSQGLMRSNLPSAEQLSLHVDYDKFMSLVNRDLPFKMKSEDLAPAVHDCYRKHCKEKDEPIKYDMEYSKLPEEIKADNLAAAERIPEVLSLVGLMVVPEGHQLRAVDTKALEDNIEFLAEAEHDAWLEHKFRSGWVYGLPRDDDKKVHNALIPYIDLAETDKQKDRDAVLNYPVIVKMAGYKIVHSD